MGRGSGWGSPPVTGGQDLIAPGIAVHQGCWKGIPSHAGTQEGLSSHGVWEDKGQKSQAEPAVCGQCCFPNPPPPGWGCGVKPCLSQSQQSKRNQTGIEDTKTDFGPRIQLYSFLVLWQHLWVLPDPPWDSPRVEAHDKDSSVSWSKVQLLVAWGILPVTVTATN